MKKTILTLGTVMLLLVGSTTFLSCGNTETNNNDSQEQVNEDDKIEHTQYQCPMKCEGDKTFDEKGECSVCGMDLKEV
jgi:hypothetical protein